MSRIIAKPFDATKKITKAIFKGSPNLFTTEDLNRQIDSFDYRLRTLEDTTQLLGKSDFFSYDSSKLTEIHYSHIEVRGCELYHAQEPTPFYFVEGEKVYLRLKYGDVGYSQDPSHMISGAVFEDGASYPAADHRVITEWQLTTEVTPGDNEEYILVAEPWTIPAYDGKDKTFLVIYGAYLPPLRELNILRKDLQDLRSHVNSVDKFIQSENQRKTLLAHEEDWFDPNTANVQEIHVSSSHIQAVGHLIQLDLYGLQSGRDTTKVTMYFDVSNLIKSEFFHQWEVNMKKHQINLVITIEEGTLYVSGTIAEDYVDGDENLRHLKLGAIFPNY